MVSESLRGVLSQQLVPRKDGTGRVAAVEVLFNSIAVANAIRKANTTQLLNAMQFGRNLGMVQMDESLRKPGRRGDDHRRGGMGGGRPTRSYSRNSLLATPPLRPNDIFFPILSQVVIWLYSIDCSRR